MTGINVDSTCLLNFVRWSSMLNFPSVIKNDTNDNLSDDEIISDWTLELGSIIGSFHMPEDKINFIDSIIHRISSVLFLQKFDSYGNNEKLGIFNNSHLILVRDSMRRKRDNITKHWYNK